MRAWWIMLAALLGAVALAVVGTTPPGPRGVDAPLGDFSAVRAMADVRAIARAPHPSGSEEHVRVRALLVARLTALGMETATTATPMSAESARWLALRRGSEAPAPPIVNIVATLAGSDRSLPAVLLMAHYDSVWGSPGAADDGAGVAAILETVRAVAAAGAPKRDLMVLLTDGEELGLVGAKAFFATDPRRGRVGVVINAEARGGGGRTSMFETGNANGAMMALFADSVRAPVATSLSVFVYRLLPNGTDLTEAKARGLPGFNFSFIGRPGLYHSPLATPDALDQGALQDMGGQMLDLTRGLLVADALPARSPDATFFDVFGLFLVIYPPVVGWVLLAAASGLFAVAAWRRAGVGEVLRGAAATVALIVLAGVLLYGANLLSGADGAVNYYDRLAAIPRLQVQALLVCAAAFVVVAGVLRRGRVGFTVGAALPLLLLGAFAQYAAPTAAYPIVVPLLLGAAALAAGRWLGEPVGTVAAVVAAMLGAGYMIEIGYLLIQAIGPTMPMVVALPLAIGGVLVWPLMPDVPRRGALIAAAALLTVAAGLALWVRLDPIAASVAMYSSDH